MLKMGNTIKNQTYFVQFLGSELLLVVNQQGRENKQEKSVTDITEHNTEEEREGNESKHSRVDLAVMCHTVRVDNFLVCVSELVGLEVSWGCLVRGDNTENGRNQGVRALLKENKYGYIGTARRNLQLLF